MWFDRFVNLTMIETAIINQVRQQVRPPGVAGSLHHFGLQDESCRNPMKIRRFHGHCRTERDLLHTHPLRLRGGDFLEDWTPPILFKLPLGSRGLLLLNVLVYALGMIFEGNPLIGRAAAPTNFGFRPSDISDLGGSVMRSVSHILLHSSLLHSQLPTSYCLQILCFDASLLARVRVWHDLATHAFLPCNFAALFDHLHHIIPGTTSYIHTHIHTHVQHTYMTHTYTHTHINTHTQSVIFNMGSLISVGTRLEKLMGTAPFLLMCAQLIVGYAGLLLTISTMAAMYPFILE